MVTLTEGGVQNKIAHYAQYGIENGYEEMYKVYQISRYCFIGLHKLV